MGNFNRDNKFSKGSGGRDFGRREFSRPEMFKAVCSKCGKDCEVPFRPTGSKPVFCRDCFKANGGFAGNRSENRSFDRPQFDNRNNDRPRTEQPNYKEQFEALNTKLDRILKIIAPTVSEKPVVVKEKPQEKIAEVVEKKKRVSKKKSAVTKE